jgi:predicted extracellular nuclease
MRAGFPGERPMIRPTLLPRAALLLAPGLLLACSALPTADRASVQPIGHVQGGQPRSALVGQTVAVQGVVSARVGDGWFVQDRGDGDDATSDAIFVQGARDAAQPGDEVRVRGVVAELEAGAGTRTALVDAQVERIGAGGVQALALTAAPADWEALEGMRVRIDAPLYLAETRELEKRGRVQVSIGGRLWQPTERAIAGSDDARAIAADNARRSLYLEGGTWPPEMTQARTGSRIAPASGVIDHSGKAYALRLETTPSVLAAERPQPPRVPGNLRIAALNLENLFNGDGRGGGFPTPRGARSPQELAAQLAKHVATLRGLDADVIALMELENDGYGAQSSLAALVDALNAGGGQWRFVDAGHGPGDNPIRVGLVYRADRVRTRGRPSTLEGGPFGPHSRVPLAQAFAPVRGGPTFVVVANHFKSKGCTDAEGADRDQHDGASCYNAMRTDSARRLHEWLATDPTGQRSDLTLVVGDLNAYAGETPVRALLDAGWRDAFAVAGVTEPYSYVYDGRIGRLDHALLSPAFAQRLRGAAEWHANADEPESSGYRDGGAGPWRSSDHDPLLLGFEL